MDVMFKVNLHNNFHNHLNADSVELVFSKLDEWVLEDHYNLTEQDNV